MKKAIFFKEWIKTRRYWLLASLLSLLLVGYVILQMQRVIAFKGVEHLWEILLSRDVVFTEMLRYLPAVIGLLLAVVQFVPEMQQKRLKLSLHLPYAQNKTIAWMLLAGVVELSSVFLLHYAILALYLHAILAPELVARILLTSLPWYLCGLIAYLFTAWIVLEPTWRRRTVDLTIGVGAVRLCFLSDTPQAYDTFLIGLTLLTAAGFSLVFLSTDRFKTGKQD